MAARHTRPSKHRTEEPRPIDGAMPPHDLVAERAVISASILDASACEDAIAVLGDALDEVGERTLHPKFFSLAHKRIMAGICALRADKIPIDAVSVHTWLRDRNWLAQADGAVYLAEVIDATPSVSNVRAHAQIVFDKWRLREHIANCQRSLARGYHETNAQELLDEHIGKTNALATENAGLPMVALGSGLVEGIEESFNLVQSGVGMMGTRTHFDELDAKIAGLHEGDLYIIAARPGMGKTSAAMQIAVNIASTVENANDLFRAPTELGVAVFSLEMPMKQLRTRLVCTDAMVDLGRYRNGYCERAEWERLFKSAAALTPLPLWIDDTSGIPVSKIRAKTRQLQSAWTREASVGPDGRPRASRKLGAVIIDYLQLIGDDGTASTREEAVARISKSLKQMAKDLSVPVIALSQLNRSVETRGKDKRPMLSDLRESGAIEQDADAILFLYRDEYYHPGKPETANVAEVIIAKQRNGPTGKVLLRFESKCTRFSNLSLADKQAYVASSGTDDA